MATSPVLQAASTAKGVAMFATTRTSSSPLGGLSILAVFLALPAATEVALAQDGLIGWGAMVVDSRFHEQAFVEVAAGSVHTVARRSDGSVVAWGLNEQGTCNVPALP